MSNLFPLLGHPQISSNVSTGTSIPPESSTHVKQDHSTLNQQTSSPAFSQVLRDLHGRLPHQGTVIQTRGIDGQADDEPVSFLTQQELENVEAQLEPDLRETLLGESQASGFQSQASQASGTRSAYGQHGISDSVRLSPPTVKDRTAADQLDGIQSRQPGTVSTISETQVLANAVVQRQAFQSTDGGRASGAVSQVRVTHPLVSESAGVIAQVVPSKISEVGAASSQGDQAAEPKRAAFLPHQDGEQGVRSLASIGKNGPIVLPPTNRPIQHDEVLTLTNHPPSTHSRIDLHQLRQQTTPLATAVAPSGPAGFAQTDSIAQLTGRSIPGSTSIGNDLSSAVRGNRTTLQIDPLGDTGLLNKGDRSQAVIETATKIVGIDASGGQGLGSGMNYPQHSQTGNQQSYTLTAQSMGVRGLEERAADIPAPALQRLQMDVQLSETQRVSIDVGVQNRQVYAGLVTDHTVLRNLATQFVPQLENQLADVDMELQEFSAEVREERQQQDDPVFRQPSLTGHKTGQTSQQELVTSQSSLNRLEHAGLHLVA